ncbi:MAG: deoxyguanosinetriphosphate triphosphohydrolase [Propylenella sp.]
MAEPPHELLRRGERWRAPYASDPAVSRGRVHAEPDDPLRSAFQRDRDRIVHSHAFRRLMHKTQVFIQHEGDHFRTRLTHTLEVAQIARSIARPLGLDEDLAETLALAHDLGHPPFGHAGERALDRALSAHEGFDHNAQSLRVVTALERRYPEFDGLNLTWETHEGLVKHNGPVCDAEGRSAGPYAGGALPHAIRIFQEQQDLELHLFAGPEAQAAAISDDIAYDCHDLEDGLRAELITLADLHDVPLSASVLRSLRDDFPNLEPARIVHELVRRMIAAMIRNVLDESARRIEEASIRSIEDVRRAGAALIRFSPDMARSEAALKRFLYDRIYRSEPVMRPARLAEAIVADVFEAFSADPARMPDDWGRGLDPDDAFGCARRVADYIAGMTDRYAISEHRRLFGATPDLN